MTDEIQEEAAEAAEPVVAGDTVAGEEENAVEGRSLSDIVPEVLAAEPEPEATEEAPLAEVAGTPAAEGPEQPAAEGPVEPDAEPAASSETEAPSAPAQRGVAWWPFLVYGGMWMVFAGLLGYSLYTAPPAMPSVETPYYPFLLIAGIVLTLVGPCLALVLFFTGRDRVEPQAGFFATLLLRAATFTLAGVAVWWIVLIAADVVRLGRVL